MRSLLALIFFLLFFISSCNEDTVVAPVTNVTIDGKDYQTIKIGDQTWTSINYSGHGGISYDANNSMPDYGKYYSKSELADIILPAGWRIPTQNDFNKLAQSHGITVPSNGTQTEEVRALISETNWNNVSGTNTSGFNAHPGGYMFGTTPPIGGDIAEFWTSEGITLSIQEAGTELNKLRMVFYQSDNSPDYRFNVRFVKD